MHRTITSVLVTDMFALRPGIDQELVLPQRPQVPEHGLEPAHVPFGLARWACCSTLSISCGQDARPSWYSSRATILVLGQLRAQCSDDLGSWSGSWPRSKLRVKGRAGEFTLDLALQGKSIAPVPGMAHGPGQAPRPAWSRPGIVRGPGTDRPRSRRGAAMLDQSLDAYCQPWSMDRIDWPRHGPRARTVREQAHDLGPAPGP